MQGEKAGRSGKRGGWGGQLRVYRVLTPTPSLQVSLQLLPRYSMWSAGAVPQGGFLQCVQCRGPVLVNQLRQEEEEGADTVGRLALCPLCHTRLIPTL